MNGPTVDSRESALAILHAALAAADPRLAIRRALQRHGDRLVVLGREYDLTRIEHVFVVGFGKAGASMAQAVEEIVGERIARGWVNVKYGHLVPPKSAGSVSPHTSERIHVHEAGHPLPDANTQLGTSKILELLESAEDNDLIICLISGGGSALLELPVEGVSLDDLRTLTDALLRSGATINEMNALRKHLSQVKGGQLARHTRARIISLILSDVIGSSLDAIASGPTVPDTTTFGNALGVVEARGIRAQLPASILTHLERGARGEIPDTPKPLDASLFTRVQNVLVADNAIACQAALQAAQERGLNALLLSTYIQGEAREVARVLVAVAREITASGRPLSRPACIVAGGETTVTVRGNGKGGRNQELALAAAIEMGGTNTVGVLVLSAGTDGTDGPTDAAGALADTTTLPRAAQLGLDPRAALANNDAYPFFAALDDLIITGPTNTNVNDIMLVLVR